MSSPKSLTALIFATLVLAGCGTSGIGDILGGGNTGASSYEIRGTVESVDSQNRSVYLTNVSGYDNMLSGGSGNAVRVYFDEQTPVEYQGRTFRPTDLERGDQVIVAVDESGNQLQARSMTVTYNVSEGTINNPSTSQSTVRGTVRSIDTYDRTITLDSPSWISRFNPGTGGTGSTMVIRYDANTGVDVNGRLHPVTNLERGDVVDVQVQSSGSSYFAQRILLVRDVRR